MANAEAYATWLVQNKDKAGTPEFDTVATAYKAARGQMMAQAEESPPGLVQQAKNVGAGLVRGAGSIGATILAPVDYLNDKLNPQQNLSGLITGQQPISRNEQRRKDMDAALADITGADTKSLGYGAGKMGAEVLGTLGVGGAIANVAGRAIPAIASAPILTSIRTSGMTTGLNPATVGQRVADMGGRMLGGGITGGASAALVNPNDVKTGAMIGAAAPPAFKAAGELGNLIGRAIPAGAKAVLGLSTGVGGDAVGAAFRAGKTGATEFADNMRGNVPVTDVLDRAKQGLQTMQAAKASEYRSGMVPIQNDKTVLSLSAIDDALKNASALTAFKGQVKNETAAGAVAKMRSIVDDWKRLDPAEFHTPEGLDALKQKLGGIMEGIPFEERTARLAAGKVYAAAKEAIEKQAPEYAKVMRSYSEASQLVAEIERTLSLKPNATVDTAMRKLQSLMRNNVQTNYSGRAALAKELEQKGGVDLMPSIAGQAMNTLTPRSLSGQIGGGAAALMATHNPLLLAALPFQSPRLVGEAAYGLGRMAGGVSGGVNALQRAIDRSPRLSGLLNDPGSLSELGQFAYRAAPVSLLGR